MQPLIVVAKIALMTCLMTDAAWSATVMGVRDAGKTIIVKLSQREQRVFKTGDTIAVRIASAKEPINGVILSIDNGIATINAGENRASLKDGERVRIASVLPTSSRIVAPTIDDNASTSPFHMSLFHPDIVSPAQIHRIQSLRTDFAGGIESQDLRVGVGEETGKVNIRGPVVKAGLVSRDQAIDMRIGILAEHTHNEGRFEFGEIDETFTMEESSISPVASFRIRPRWSIGITYQVVQDRRTGDFFEANHTISYDRPGMGVLYSDRKNEFGVAYQAKVDVKNSLTADDGSERPVTIQKPAVIQIHGHRQLDSRHSAFATLAHNQNQAFNGQGENPWRNNFQGQLGFARALNTKIRGDGGLHFYSPANHDEKNLGNIMRYGIFANYLNAYKTGKDLGAGVSYWRAAERYSDASGDNVKLNSDAVSFNVTGIFKL